MTRDDISEAASLAVGDRIRQAVKAVLEQIREEEITRYAGTRSTSERSTGSARRAGPAKGTAATDGI